ncbi:MAG: ubiquinone biosynthesis regulatory protein kinase UbiB [Gammaproteobacteria bacterium]|nr:ubiquinone biosynthesis regulatory protein kinase UbiB [Gammaproteobacteria bacterium]
MIRNLSRLLRLLHINVVLARNGLDEVIFATHLFRPFRFVLWLLPWHWLPRRLPPRAVRLRRTLEDLGPIFIKFGQILSTRRDLLPDDIADELARLQDNVRPFPGQQARAIIERAYGRPLAGMLNNFDPQPLASASIAQVHTALLPDGREVIVKVVRPGIRREIERDIDLLYALADLATRYWPDGRRLRPRAVVAEFEKTLLDELDLQREAANASQLRRNFAGSPLLYVPEVHWEYTRRNVMVMERIHGTPISDIATLKRHNIDLKQLAERGVEIFFTQVFSHNFFHADMHPGNIFVSPQGQYIAVDFGIVGTLRPEDQHYLAENFLAFFNRDYRRVAELHVQSGWAPSGTRVDEFESAIRSVCEPIFERPLKDISFGRLLLHLFQTARRFNMEIQPQLVLLQKTLLNIEGLGRQLYPELDLWQTAKPFLERWTADQVGPKAFFRALRDNAKHWLTDLPQLPGLAHEALRRLHDGTLRIETTSKDVQQLRDEIRAASQRNFRLIIAATLLICATLIYSLDGIASFMIFGMPWLSWLLGSAAVMLLVVNWPQRGDGDD